MRRILTSLLLVSIFSSQFLASVEASSPKAGSSCKTLKTSLVFKGSKYTCVKKGKKSVWSKGVQKSAQLPNVTQVPDSQPLKPESTAVNTPHFSVINFSLFTGSSVNPLGVTRGEINVGSSGESPAKVIIEIAGLNGGASIYSWNATEVSSDNLSSKWAWQFTIPADSPTGNLRIVVDAFTTLGTPMNLISDSFRINPDWIDAHPPLIPSSCSDSSCPQSNISTISTSVSNCKIIDPASQGGVAEGFPRPNGALEKQANYKVLVIPISFSDLPFTQEESAFVESRFAYTSREFQYLSEGFSKITATIVDKSHWISVASAAEEFFPKTNTTDQNERIANTKLLALADRISLSGYDAIWFTSARSDKFSFGSEMPYVVYPTSSGNVNHVFTVIGGDGLSVDHGLGHLIFYFDDEYQFSDWVDPFTSRGQPLVGWDIYGRGYGLLGWNRWLVGWVNDSQVQCIPINSNGGMYRINYINSTEAETKLLVFPTGPSTAIVAEYRDNLGLTETGLFVYKVDLTIPQGQMRFRGDNRILGLGESSIIDKLKFTLEASSNNYIYVKVESA